MKNIILILSVLFFLFSCKKEKEKKDPCTNGFKDIGEVGIDCGGSCKPCPVVYLETVSCLYNGQPMSFQNRTLEFVSNAYVLRFHNDTLSFQIRFGENVSAGNDTIYPTGNLITKTGTSSNFSFSNVSSQTCYLGPHDTNAHRMSGLFDLNFYQAGSTADTVRITGGSFQNLIY